MSIPSHTQLMLPLLQTLKDKGGSARPRDLYNERDRRTVQFVGRGPQRHRQCRHSESQRFRATRALDAANGRITRSHLQGRAVCVAIDRDGERHTRQYCERFDSHLRYIGERCLLVGQRRRCSWNDRKRVGPVHMFLAALSTVAPQGLRQCGAGSLRGLANATL